MFLIVYATFNFEHGMSQSFDLNNKTLPYHKLIPIMFSGVPDRGSASEADWDELWHDEAVHRVCGGQTDVGAWIQQGKESPQCLQRSLVVHVNPATYTPSWQVFLY